MKREDIPGRRATFAESVKALVEFAMNDGANGCPPGQSQQTREAAKWLRAAYRDALEDAASAAEEK